MIRKCVTRACRLSRGELYVVLFGLSLLITGCQDPPIHELQVARQAVENARREGALVFAPDLYSLAESELTIAEEEFHEQSRKVFWARDYSMATRLMMLAQTDAREALSLAQEEKQKTSMSDQDPPPLLSHHSDHEEFRLTNGDDPFRNHRRRGGPSVP
ncbi:DUF4398 domain-containing protein [Nitrospira sp. Ecomares 2.1]